jgi:hypothetical protein
MLGCAPTLAGCDDYATHSVHNAPGIVDLSTPLPHENGDPKRFEVPADPGFDTISIWTNPYILWGHGRLPASGASREAGLELHFERAEGSRLDANALGITAGVAFAQWGDNRRTDAIGAFYGELDYRFVLGESWAASVGLGPAFYAHQAEAGVQVSFRMPLGLLHVRYMASSGIEVLGGLELPFPFFFSRSR